MDGVPLEILMRLTPRAAFTLAVLVASASLAACDAALNGDLIVPAAAVDQRGGLTVNGRIAVGAEAEVDGDLRTVNGDAEVGAGSRLHDLSVVNGRVRIADGVQLGRVACVNGDVTLGMRVKAGGDVATVNGRLQVGGGSIVDGDARTVNGPLELRGATVRGAVENHAGDVRLLDGTLVEGDLRLAPPDQPGRPDPQPDVIVIGVGAQVRGTVRAERPVRLFVHPSARLGKVEGVVPQPFEGTDVTNL